MRFLVDFLPFNINGIATPFGVLIKKSSYNKYILEHEIIHYHQMRKGRALFLLDYIKEHILKGYDKNKYEIGASLVLNSSLSIMSLINISKGIDLGYAYQTNSGNKLSGLNLKTHEIVLRIKFENLIKESDSESEEDKEESEEVLNLKKHR